jgi:hypothetical protein
LLSRLNFHAERGCQQRLELRGERPKVDGVFFCGDETICAGLLFEGKQAINVWLAVRVMVAEGDFTGERLASGFQAVFYAVEELLGASNAAESDEFAAGIGEF